MKKSEKLTNIDDRTAEAIVGRIYEAMPNLKGVLGTHAFDPKMLIRFTPVAKSCEESRVAKGVSIKEAAAELKIQQYKLKEIESSGVGRIDIKALEAYVDWLGLREFFAEWRSKNEDVYKAVGRRKAS